MLIYVASFMIGTLDVEEKLECLLTRGKVKIDAVMVESRFWTALMIMSAISATREEQANGMITFSIIQH